MKGEVWFKPICERPFAATCPVSVELRRTGIITEYLITTKHVEVTTQTCYRPPLCRQGSLDKRNEHICSKVTQLAKMILFFSPSRILLKIFFNELHTLIDCN